MQVTIPKPAPIAPTDSFLQELAAAANAVDPEGNGFVSVVLSVGGQTVSGMLTSGRAFFEAQHRACAAAGGDATLREAVVEACAEFRDRYPARSDAAKERPADPAYLHLKGAQFFANGVLPMPANGMWWRVKISSVDGFSIGTMGASVQ